MLQGPAQALRPGAHDEDPVYVGIQEQVTETHSHCAIRKMNYSRGVWCIVIWHAHSVP